MNNSAGLTTILGPDVQLSGKVLRFAGDVHLYGAVDGDIDVEAGLVVAEGGSIDGDVEAESAQIGGTLTGDIRCERIDIKRTGVVTGVIYATRWSMEQGAVIEAEFVHANRAELIRRVPELEEAYLAALKHAGAMGGTEPEPSEAYLAWSRRLADGPGSRSKFADKGSVGRAAWSKGVGDEAMRKRNPGGPDGGDLFEDQHDG